MISPIIKLHAKTKAFEKKLLQAQKIVTEAYTKCSFWYVALSGGKDSTVVYNLLDKRIPAVFSDDEWWLPETEAYIRGLIDNGHDVRWIRTEATHTDWFSTEGDWKGIPDYAAHNDWQGVFLGLRKDENSHRRMHLNRCGPLFYAQSDSFWHCSPLANWSVIDVWAYIYSRQIEYNKAYDKLSEMGIPIERQRIGPLAVERVLGYGQLAVLKKGWPDLYNRFARKYPEARAYV